MTVCKQKSFFSPPLPRGADGFTFLEMIAALGLLALLTAIFGMGLVAAVQSYYFSRTNVEVAQKGELAMLRLSRELTELTDIRAIDTAGNASIIYERIEDDVAGQPQRVLMGVLYDPSTGTIQLYDHLAGAVFPQTAGQTLTDDVRSFSLNFYQGDNTWLPQSDIRLLSTIRINLNMNRPDSPDHPHAFTTLVFLRNTHNVGGAAPP